MISLPWISRVVLIPIIPILLFTKYMERNAKYVRTKFWILDPYFVVHTKHVESVLTPPGVCVSVYHQSMQMGLWFPLHPFIKDLLNDYQQTLTQLFPNSWLSINEFIFISHYLGISSSFDARP